MKWNFGFASFALVVFGLAFPLAAPAAAEKPSVNLTRDQVEEIVLRSYQYVAMFNVNNKFAMDPNKHPETVSSDSFSHDVIRATIPTLRNRAATSS